MNKVILMGRLTRNPEVRYTQGERQMAIARYTLAVDRRGRGNAGAGEQTADFIQCVAFDRSGEFAEKYFHQGTKIVVTGRLQMEATPTRMAREFIQQTWLLRIRSLQRVGQPVRMLATTSQLHPSQELRHLNPIIRHIRYWLHEHPRWSRRRRTAV